MPIDSSPLLLDTHYWIWLQSGVAGRFPGKLLKLIEGAADRGKLLLSVMSIWEVGMLEAKGRITLQCPCDQWVETALATPGLQLAALSAEIALDSTRLPGSFHGDPVDRILIATARRMGARLLTLDRRLIECGRKGHLRVVETRD
ncbi:MAG: type II toxin-antitoxin system VapC family toxin [Bryobacteraceae bacterium]